MNRCGELQRDIQNLEAKLDSTATIAELARVREGLADQTPRTAPVKLQNVRIGSPCKQRWEDMVGDARIRACAGCDRPVFNLSEMTQEQAERVLATRGLTPCVRFYRRADGTVMTKDCPSGTQVKKRHLTVVASTFAAGTVLASASASAQPADPTTTTDPDSTDETPQETQPDPCEDPVKKHDPEISVIMGGISDDHEMGAMVYVEAERPKLEWSVWGRIGFGRGASSQRSDVLARTLTPPESGRTSITEAAIAADLTLGIAARGNLRIGIWGELRTTTDAVAGGELVVGGFGARHSSDLGRGGSVVVRLGGNADVATAAVGVGFVGSWPASDYKKHWTRHVVGARIVGSFNQSRDTPADWSATLGLEVEPLGVVHAVYDVVKGR